MRLVTYLTLLEAFVYSSQVFPQRRVVVVLDAVVRPIHHTLVRQFKRYIIISDKHPRVSYYKFSQ